MSLLGTSILFKNGEYAIRHELWALEFLVRIYSKMCNNSESTFDNRYGFGHIIQFVLNNIGINEWLNILYSTANFYDEEHFQPFAKIIISNFIRFAENLPSPADKTKLYSYGLGYFHYIIKDHSNAIAYYDRALEIEPNSAYIWLNKGVAYHALGEHEDAIKCYDEALKIEPNDASIWYNKGLTLIILTLYRDAIECFDKALRIKQDYANALVGKGMAFYSLAVDENDIIKNREAAKCFDRTLKIEPNNAFGGYHRALYKVRQGHIDDGLADLEKAIDIDETLIEQAERDFDILRNNERFTSLMKKSKK